MHERPQERPKVGFLRITEPTLVSHRIYDADFFSQLSMSFHTVRVDPYRSVDTLAAWLEDVRAQGVDYLFVYIFSTRYPHYLDLLRIRNERRLPVNFILVPCILVPGLDETYRELPRHLGDRDVVFVFSEFVRERLSQISKRYDDFTTPCFIDCEAFAGNTKAPSDTLDIVYCARLVPEKGFAPLLRALHELAPDHRFRLHVITDARKRQAPRSYVDEVNRLIREFGLQPHVRFYGSLVDEQQRRRDIMSRCDVLVHLTMYEGETFGRIVVEAFAAGLAVITTNWQGVNESVTPENGYLIDVHDRGGEKHVDIAEVARALEALYRPETLMRFKQVNRAKAAQYDYRAHVRRLRDLIDARLGGPSP